jgi:hypothetical protein
MRVELNPEEAKYLNQILERHLTGLIREISHTDSREYKSMLKAEADFLNSLKSKFMGDEKTADAGSSIREESLNTH